MNPSMRHWLWMVGLVALFTAAAQKYNGPLPAKPDVLYIKQASDLIATELADVKSEKAGSGTRFTVAGSTSPVRTPVPLPIFLVKVDKLAPDQLQLYRMESKDGHREFVVGGSNPPDILHMDVTRTGADGLWRLSVSDPLDPGEYVLSAEGSKQVFCFQVF